MLRGNTGATTSGGGASAGTSNTGSGSAPCATIGSTWPTRCLGAILNARIGITTDNKTALIQTNRTGPRPPNSARSANIAATESPTADRRQYSIQVAIIGRSPEVF